ncbi:hypothetical protein COO60DRAFT_304 [Scenedesmus sp. NREL 46B-D3]|nr:hypothetical protein COO60DRAFT_304 [Scenedesmus sp. NREL 46B-D3]
MVTAVVVLLGCCCCFCPVNTVFLPADLQLSFQSRQSSRSNAFSCCSCSTLLILRSANCLVVQSVWQCPVLNKRKHYYSTKKSESKYRLVRGLIAFGSPLKGRYCSRLGFTQHRTSNYAGYH